MLAHDCGEHASAGGGVEPPEPPEPPVSGATSDWKAATATTASTATNSTITPGTSARRSLIPSLNAAQARFSTASVTAWQPNATTIASAKPATGPSGTIPTASTKKKPAKPNSPKTRPRITCAAAAAPAA